LEYFDADICSGVSISQVGDRVPETYQNYRLADQLDTGNVMIHRRVFERVGLFDRQFEGQRMGDGEFGLRAFLAGFRIVSSPDAERLHLKAAVGGLRELGSWDAFRPSRLFAPRPIPSVLYLLRKYFGTRQALLSLVVLLPPSIVPYRFKANRSLRAVTFVLAPLLLPLLVVQVALSWRAASAKLAEGAKIDTLCES
jgi:hypothetical protein